MRRGVHAVGVVVVAAVGVGVADEDDDVVVGDGGAADDVVVVFVFVVQGAQTTFVAVPPFDVEAFVDDASWQPICSCTMRHLGEYDQPFRVLLDRFPDTNTADHRP